MDLDTDWLQVELVIWLLCLLFSPLFVEKLLVLLRDGRKLMGILRSFDQFGIVLSVLLFS